jgi:hypothetical protein
VTLHRRHAEALDRADALAGLRERFVLNDPLRIYADGNSLGRLPHETVVRIEALVREWGDRLVGGWEDWIELPVRIGDEIGDVIGARAGETLACDSTTINLYKLASAALDLAGEQRAVLVDEHDFPTDRYVLEGIAAAGLRALALLLAIRGGRLGGGARGLLRPLQAQHQLDQLFLAQTLKIAAAHQSKESAKPSSRKPLSNYSLAFVSYKDRRAVAGALKAIYRAKDAEAGQMAAEAVEAPIAVETRRLDENEKIGRNDPCWCGSGKKFKKCHGA